VTESNKHYWFAVDVPGVKHNDKSIELENDDCILRLSGSRKANTGTSYEEFKFDRQFTLGDNLDILKITAHLSDGVLVLMARKKEELPLIKQVFYIFGERCQL
jgi:HSP20 family molecular chaperone IbpA